MSKLSLIAVSLSVLGGCLANGAEGSDDVTVAHTSQNVVSANGISPNGISPNGISPNGISPNGISPNGISPNGVSLNGISPNGISPNGDPVIAVNANGTPLTGAAVVGSLWTGELSDGSRISLRVDAAQQLAGANADMWSYAISTQLPTGAVPLCGSEADGTPIHAVTVQGTWNMARGVVGGGAYHADSGKLTIACRRSAIAKCVELGYKPWHGYSEQLGGCVRALRADYCGDGNSYTVDGTLVNVYDDAGLQTDDMAWQVEAEWTAAGARCITHKRYTRFEQLGAAGRPSCLGQLQAPRCGDSFANGAALITELAPR